MKICTCLNCMNIYHDVNPSGESIEYKNDASIPDLEYFENGEDSFVGCPECRTDDYLSNNIHQMANKKTTNKFKEGQEIIVLHQDGRFYTETIEEIDGETVWLKDSCDVSINNCHEKI